MDAEAALAVIRKDGNYEYDNDGRDIDGLKVRLYSFLSVAEYTVEQWLLYFFLFRYFGCYFRF